MAGDPVLGLLAAAVWVIWNLVREFIPPFRHSRPPSRYLRMRQQARRGNAKACVACADMLEKGSDGARHNPDLAMQYLYMALDIYGRQARDGDGHAWLKMAEIHNRHHEPHQTTARADHCYRHALKLNVAAAEAGDGNGMAFAGFQYFYGLGCIADAERAAHYLEGAAKLGHAPSLKTLADYHMLGVQKEARSGDGGGALSPAPPCWAMPRRSNASAIITEAAWASWPAANWLTAGTPMRPGWAARAPSTSWKRSRPTGRRNRCATCRTGYGRGAPA
ncbi:MAG: tetratricopeptide repeat protein [Asticcacaulis sp.]